MAGRSTAPHRIPGSGISTQVTAGRVRPVLSRLPVAGLLLLLILPALGAQNLPPLRGRVNDSAGMISRSTEARLEEMLAALEASDSTQIVVATVPSLEGLDIESYGIRLAEQWKIGQEREDNGAILLVARDERQIRIEVGYGLEGSLTDLIAGRIIRNIITPAFQAGDFDRGFEDATAAMIAAVRGEYQGSGTLPARSAVPADGEVIDGGVRLPFFPGYIIPLIIFVGFVNLAGGRAAYGRRRSSILPWLFLFGSTRHYGSGHHSSFHRSHHSGFSGGGGFGGFSGGGGSFGGGGASGGW